LPFKQAWQRLANDLPSGDALFVVPEEDLPIRTSMKRVAGQLRRRGRHVAAVSASRFR
jgi:hypothetical protein